MVFWRSPLYKIDKIENIEKKKKYSFMLQKQFSSWLSTRNGHFYKKSNFLKRKPRFNSPPCMQAMWKKA